MSLPKLKLSNLKNPSLSKYGKQAGAELGQAQLKLGLDFTLFLGRFGLVELVCWVSFCRFDLKDLA